MSTFEGEPTGFVGMCKDSRQKFDALEKHLISLARPLARYYRLVAYKKPICEYRVSSTGFITTEYRY